jgi:hypothetical protein
MLVLLTEVELVEQVLQTLLQEHPQPIAVAVVEVTLLEPMQVEQVVVVRQHLVLVLLELQILAVVVVLVEVLVMVLLVVQVE